MRLTSILQRRGNVVPFEEGLKGNVVPFEEGLKGNVVPFGVKGERSSLWG
jgi:uncharacterized protein YkvS